MSAGPLSTTHYPVSRQECWDTLVPHIIQSLDRSARPLSTAHYPVSRQECWATQYHTLSSL
ncbi:hypothetical protein DPMN_101739 [Dreissena polymorpha]|uniref:Uncharacterized protein n=1 Tax=Dreissena polymorpha TaxID=45954 RepID=A0A9D4LLQ0_DREPO|nr:hypothetical protein DPMN_101739 [Dreissena polymorpha]